MIWIVCVAMPTQQNSVLQTKANEAVHCVDH